MRTKTGKVDFLGKLTAFSMALILLLSIFVPMYAGTVNADAAASSTFTAGQQVIVHLTEEAASSWSDPMQVRFTNSSGTTLATVKLTGVTTDNALSILVPDEANGATNVVVDNLDATKQTILDEINALQAANSDKTLVLYDNSSSNWGSVYYYVWKQTDSGTVKNASWPGQKTTNTLTSNSNIFYVLVDKSTYENIIFSNNGSSQTDQGHAFIDSNNNDVAKNFYDSASNKWIEYSAISSSTSSVAAADRAGNDKNHLYITGEKKAEWSKYGDTITTQTIYFRPNSNWSSAYVTYDESDPYSRTVEMTVYNQDPLVYTAQVPAGATLTFSSNADGSGTTAKNVYYDGSDTNNAYIMSDRQWDTLEKALTKTTQQADYTVTANNFSEVTGKKVIGVTATYFDYLSNNERSGSWRNNLNDDSGYENGYCTQFSDFNDMIRDVALNDNSWRYPLFFGDDYDANSYIDTYYNALNGTRNGSISQNLFQAANNANYLNGKWMGDWASGTTGTRRSRSVLGLVQNTLSGGELMVTSSTKAPWFDYDALHESDDDDDDDGSTTKVYTIQTWKEGNYYKVAIPKHYTNISINNNNSKYEFALTTDISGKSLYTNNTSQMFSGTVGTYGSSGYDDNYWYVTIEDNGSWGQLYAHVWDTNNSSKGTTCPGVKIDGTTYDDPAPVSTVTTSGDYAKVVNAQFPFVANTDSSGVTTYSFDSADATDNVYFTWSDDGEPTAVNYGAGTSYGVSNKTGGYGIFPFNNAGDSARDYGFGIKMEMEFTLPMNGVYGGETVTVSAPTANQFYIKPETQNRSTICLYLYGGTDSSKAVTISNKITDCNGVNYFVVEKSDVEQSDGTLYPYIIIKPNSGTSDWRNQSKGDNATKTEDLFGSCWSAYEATGNNWTPAQYSDFKAGTTTTSTTPALFEYTGDDDLWVFIDGQLVLDLGGAHTPATGTINFGAGTNQISSTAANVYAILNGGDNGTTDTDLVGGDHADEHEVTNTFSINNTDPTRKHTMTVFYMERGTNDSNLKVSYTIQPVQNDLTVDKTVETGDVNSGIASAVKAAVASSDFDFTLKDNNAAYASKSYTLTKPDHTSESKTTSANGEFTLKQDYSANFTKDLKYNDSISISESAPSVFSYDTSYTITDNKTGDSLGNGDGKDASFSLINKDGDEDSGASVYVEYTNTLKTANLTLNKNLFKEDGTTESTDLVPFEFTIEVDLDGDGTAYSYQAYDLEYSLSDNTGIATAATYIADDGKFSIRPDQTATILNLPVGAKYRITESAKAGYVFSGVAGAESTSGSSAVGTITESGAGVAFSNKEKPASSGLQAQKTLDGATYSGSDFSFTAELIRRDGGETISAENLKAMYNGGSASEKSDVVNGYVSFADFTVVASDSNVGKYVFKITEAATADSSPYNYDKTVYYAVIEVTAGSVATPVYYTDEACTSLVGSDGKIAPTFENTTKGQDVQLTKTNESGTALKGAEFDIYKDADCTEKLTTNAYGDAITTVTSGEDGVVKFEKILLGTYYIKETKAPNGYQLLTSPVKVEVTPDGVTLSGNSLLSGSAADGYKLKNVKQPELPLAGGSGSTWLFVLGTVLVAVAGSALIFYKKRTQVFAFIKNKLNR